jgi:hypothetical protein
MFHHITTTIAAVLCLLLASLALPSHSDAQATPEKIAELGQSLTPMGSPRAGSADGTIPEWTGGLTAPPANYKEGEHLVDPFPDDAILFTITPTNLDQYRDKLTVGQIAMFEKYPDTYKMNVYQTRRTAAYPQRVYDALASNAKTSALAHEGNGVTGAVITSPFPFPENGLHAIWNHKLRYQGRNFTRTYRQITPQRGGSFTPVKLKEEVDVRYAAEGVTPENVTNLNLTFLQSVTAPARLAGFILLVHETLDQVAEPRQAWTYNPGQRRVRRAPNVAYDNPGTASDGLRTNDNLDLFNGAPDRYDWELVGQKEIYVPYNSYKIQSSDYKLDDVIQAGHINQDLARYELHRVWVVEARLKEGFTHVYSRRTMYFDEDSWNLVLVDHYDSRGDLWRPSEAHVINFYQVPLATAVFNVIYDLPSGRYLVNGLHNEDRAREYDTKGWPSAYFTPGGLRMQGRR